MNLTVEAGFVVAGVVDEIAMLPVDVQDPALVAHALACARVLDDPESVMRWPQTFAHMAALLDALHGMAGE